MASFSSSHPDGSHSVQPKTPASRLTAGSSSLHSATSRIDRRRWLATATAGMTAIGIGGLTCASAQTQRSGTAPPIKLGFSLANYRLLFSDDLSFEPGDGLYKPLKAALDGSIAAPLENIGKVILA